MYFNCVDISKIEDKIFKFRIMTKRIQNCNHQVESKNKKRIETKRMAFQVQYSMQIFAVRYKKFVCFKSNKNLF